VLFDCDLSVQADNAHNGVPGMVNRVI
jgi:hypothetical protein